MLVNALPPHLGSMTCPSSPFPFVSNLVRCLASRVVLMRFLALTLPRNHVVSEQVRRISGKITSYRCHSDASQHQSMQRPGRSLPRFATCVSALCNATSYHFCTLALFSVTMRINPALRPSVSAQFMSSPSLFAALRIGSVLILRTSLLLSSEQSLRHTGPSCSFALRDRTTL